MHSFVFDYEEKILGILEHNDEYASPRFHRSFQMPAIAATPWRLGEAPAATVEHLEFEWAKMSVVRDITGMSQLRVLKTRAEAAQLNRLRSFKWFSEEYGEWVPAGQVRRA
jgi:hypothetical protein